MFEMVYTCTYIVLVTACLSLSSSFQETMSIPVWLNPRSHGYLILYSRFRCFILVFWMCVKIVKLNLQYYLYGMSHMYK